METEGWFYLLLTFNILSKAHGGGDVLALCAGLFLHHIIVTGHVTRGADLFLLLLFVAWRQLFGEGKHGEDDQEHGYSTQEKAAPPERENQQMGC